jgi:hypothetical protein
MEKNIGLSDMDKKRKERREFFEREDAKKKKEEEAKKKKEEEDEDDNNMLTKNNNKLVEGKSRFKINDEIGDDYSGGDVFVKDKKNVESIHNTESSYSDNVDKVNNLAKKLLQLREKYEIDNSEQKKVSANVNSKKSENLKNSGAKDILIGSLSGSLFGSDNIVKKDEEKEEKEKKKEIKNPKRIVDKKVNQESKKRGEEEDQNLKKKREEEEEEAKKKRREEAKKKKEEAEKKKEEAKKKKEEAEKKKEEAKKKKEEEEAKKKKEDEEFILEVAKLTAIKKNYFSDGVIEGDNTLPFAFTMGKSIKQNSNLQKDLPKETIAIKASKNLKEIDQIDKNQKEFDYIFNEDVTQDIVEDYQGFTINNNWILKKEYKRKIDNIEKVFIVATCNKHFTQVDSIILLFRRVYNDCQNFNTRGGNSPIIYNISMVFNILMLIDNNNYTVDTHLVINAQLDGVDIGDRMKIEKAVIEGHIDDIIENYNFYGFAFSGFKMYISFHNNYSIGDMLQINYRGANFKNSNKKEIINNNILKNFKESVLREKVKKEQEIEKQQQFIARKRDKDKEEYKDEDKDKEEYKEEDKDKEEYKEEDKDKEEYKIAEIEQNFVNSKRNNDFADDASDKNLYRMPPKKIVNITNNITNNIKKKDTRKKGNRITDLQLEDETSTDFFELNQERVAEVSKKISEATWIEENEKLLRDEEKEMEKKKNNPKNIGDWTPLPQSILDTKTVYEFKDTTKRPVDNYCFALCLIAFHIKKLVKNKGRKFKYQAVFSYLRKLIKIIESEDVSSDELDKYPKHLLDVVSMGDLLSFDQITEYLSRNASKIPTKIYILCGNSIKVKYTNFSICEDRIKNDMSNVLFMILYDNHLSLIASYKGFINRVLYQKRHMDGRNVNYCHLCDAKKTHNHENYCLFLERKLYNISKKESISYTEKVKIQNSFVIYGDIEAIIDSSNEHIPCFVGILFKGMYIQFSTDQCIVDFLEFLYDSMEGEDSNTKYTIVFHNFSKYDSHFIINNISKLISNNGRFSCTMKTKEQIMSFSITYNNNKEIKFIDSYLFLKGSLDNLAKNVKIQDEDCLFYFRQEEIQYVTRKLDFPYEYIDSFEKLNETKLPHDKKDWKSSLKKTEISQEKINDMIDIFNELRFKSIGDFYSFYLKIDVFLLSIIFNKFISSIESMFNINATDYITTPALAWSAALKYTGVSLEVLHSPALISFFAEKGVIRGGVSSVGGVRALSIDDWKEENYEIKYLDVINLYGYAMTFPLPTGDIILLKEYDKEFCTNLLKTWNFNDDYGYIFNIDFEYSKDKLDILSDFPPFPQSMNGKLVANLSPRKSYRMHIANLQFALAKDNRFIDLKSIRINQVVRYKQSRWLAKYINKNTSARNEEQDPMKKELYKLMNNSVYGKTMENVFKYSNSKIYTRDSKSYESMLDDFQKNKIYSFDEYGDSLYIASKNEVPDFDKPIYVGFVILEFAKLRMYDLWYTKMSCIPDKRLIYTDTDSIIYFSKIKYASVRFTNEAFYSKEIGMLKDEYPLNVIEKIICLSSKCYYIKLRKKDEKTDLDYIQKNKGFDLREKNSYEKYKACLLNRQSDQNSYISMDKSCHTTMIQSSLHFVFTNSIEKHVFTDAELDTKRDTIINLGQEYINIYNRREFYRNYETSPILNNI